MIKFTIYRRLCVFFGSRSFRKSGVQGDTYILLKGNSEKFDAWLYGQGFVKEWPKEKK